MNEIPPPPSGHAHYLWAVSAETGLIRSLGALDLDALQERRLTEKEWQEIREPIP